MARRLIFINRYYRPDHSATSQLLTDVAEDLASSGADVMVITSRQLYENAAVRLPARETLGGVFIKRVWSTRFGRSANSGRALDYLSFLMSTAIELWRSAKPGTLVIAKTDPPFVGFVAAIVGRWRGAQTVNWVQDLFPDVAFAAGVRVPASLRALMIRLRNAALLRATMNVAIGSLMAGRIRTDVPLSKVEVIHNWVPFAHVQPIPRHRNVLRAQWGLVDRFVVGYSGNMGRAHEFDTILGAAERLKAESEVVFLLIGAGANRDAIVRTTRERVLSNVLLKPYQPAEQLAHSLSVPDVHIVTLRPEMEGCIVPSKFYGVLAAGRPVIFVGDIEGEISQLVKAHECGFTVTPGDEVRLATAIDALRKSPERLLTMSENAIRASAYYDRGRALQRWRAILRAC